MSALQTYLAGMKSALRTKKAEVQVLEKQIVDFEREMKQLQPARPVTKTAAKTTTKPKAPAKKGSKK